MSIFDSNSKYGMLIYERENYHLIWRSLSGERIISKHFLKDPPLQAVLCSFSTTTAVAILKDSRTLHIHFLRGENYEITLDYNITNLLAIESGLILQAFNPINKFGQVSPSNLFFLSYPLARLRNIPFYSISSISKKVSISDVYLIAYDKNLISGIDKNTGTVFISYWNSNDLETNKLDNLSRTQSNILSHSSHTQMDVQSPKVIYQNSNSTPFEYLVNSRHEKISADLSIDSNSIIPEKIQRSSLRNQPSHIEVFCPPVMKPSVRSSSVTSSQIRYVDSRLSVKESSLLPKTRLSIKNRPRITQIIEPALSSSPGNNIAAALGIIRTHGIDPDIDREKYRDKEERGYRLRNSLKSGYSSSPTFGKSSVSHVFQRHPITSKGGFTPTLTLSTKSEEISSPSLSQMDLSGSTAEETTLLQGTGKDISNNNNNNNSISQNPPVSDCCLYILTISEYSIDQNNIYKFQSHNGCFSGDLYSPFGLFLSINSSSIQLNYHHHYSIYSSHKIIPSSIEELSGLSMKLIPFELEATEISDISNILNSSPTSSISISTSSLLYRTELIMQSIPTHISSSSRACVSLLMGELNFPMILSLRETKQREEEDIIVYDNINRYIDIFSGNCMIATIPLAWFLSNLDQDESINQNDDSNISVYRISSCCDRSSDKFFLSHYQDKCESHYIVSFAPVLFLNRVYTHLVSALVEVIYNPIHTISAISESLKTRVINSIISVLFQVYLQDFEYPLECLLLTIFQIPFPESRMAMLSKAGALLYANCVELNPQLPAIIFDTFHAVFDDETLRGDIVWKNEPTGLLRGLVRVASAYKNLSHSIATRYTEYYSCHISISVASLPGIPTSFTMNKEIPQATLWLSKSIENLSNIGTDSGIPCDLQTFGSPFNHNESSSSWSPSKPYPSLRLVHAIFKLMTSQYTDHMHDFVPWKLLVADAFVSVTSSNLDVETALLYLPSPLRPMVALALKLNQDEPPDSWPSSVLRFIDREDLAVKSSSFRPFLDKNRMKESKIEEDGLAEVELASRELFPHDERFREVCRLLKTSKNIYLRLERSPELSDTDYRDKQQLKLFSLARRVLGCCVGRGMVTLQSWSPVMAEPLPIPELVTAGRCVPSNVILALEAQNLADLTLWPEFHNGSAAGLRIGFITPTPLERFHLKQYVTGLSNRFDRDADPSLSSDNTKGSLMGNKVTRNWIIYNRTTAQTSNRISAHAGMLLTLGLQGHLTALSMADICDYLTQGHEPTTVAVLIGIAASRFGTGDPLTSKTLCLHIPALLPSLHWDLEISPIVQSAAFAGLGLLYCRSGHRLMSELLLDELTRKPSSQTSECRESIALSAAWSLGMLLLGKGSSNANNRDCERNPQSLAGLEDLKIEDRLYMLIHGSKRPDLNSSHLFAIPQSSIDANSRSSRVLESDFINTDVTAVGATLALSLMYLKSNNNDIAKRIAIPTSSLLIDNLRADMMLYRSLGICLIMWDSVTPSDTWIDSQIPEIIKLTLFDLLGSTDVTEQNSALANIEAKLARFDDKKSLSFSSKILNGYQNNLPLRTAITAYLNIVSGLCLGLGLVFAGSADSDAKSTIINKLQLFQSLRDNKVPSSKYHLKTKVAIDKAIRPTLESCISSMALALSCVMAGSGDIDSLRLLRELRWKVEDVTYGTHMALNSAIGLLFLGGGKISLKSKSDEATACLLMSVIPRYPNRPGDNQHHLQPLRHLYALALESRILRTVDIESGQSVSLVVDIQINNRMGVQIDESTMRRTTPCLLPELSLVDSIRVPKTSDAMCRNESYFPVTIEKNRSKFSSTIYVKKRPIVSRKNEGWIDREVGDAEDEGKCYLQSILEFLAKVNDAETSKMHINELYLALKNSRMFLQISEDSIRAYK